MNAKTITTEEKAHFAIANTHNVPISRKISTEIASFVRGRKLKQAKMLLEKVTELKVAVPYKRYLRDIAHKRGDNMAAGKYPVKASKEFLNLLNTVEANAVDKGLDVNKLIITEIRANEGAHQMKPGRHSRRRMRRTHLSVKVEEK